MTAQDLTALSDEDLEQTRMAVLIEQDRRRNLARIPSQIRELSTAFLDGGGQLDELTLEPLPAPEPETPTEG